MTTAVKYAKMTQDDFDRLLAEVIDNDNPKPSSVLSIAGVYEVLSEHYNNEVLEAWELEQAGTEDE